MNRDEAKELPTKLGVYNTGYYGGRVINDVDYWYLIDKIYDELERVNNDK